MRMVSLVAVGILLIIGSIVSVFQATVWVTEYVEVPTTSYSYYPGMTISTDFLRTVGWVGLLLGSFAVFLGIIGVFICGLIEGAEAK